MSCGIVLLQDGFKITGRLVNVCLVLVSTRNTDDPNEEAAASSLSGLFAGGGITLKPPKDREPYSEPATRNPNHQVRIMNEKKLQKTINEDHLPYPDSDDDSIAPDVAPSDEQPISPAEAVRRELDKYGESSLDENRDDQLDAHHADIDDVV
jgi:hypothetical protein